MPLPRREVAELHRQPDAPDLPLLRLRRARQRGRLPDGARRAGLPRCGARPGAAGRPDGARGRQLAGRARTRRGAEAAPGHADRRARTRRRALPQGVARQPARDRLPQAPRPDRRDRGALRPRLCARGLAQPGQRLPALRRPAAGGKRPGHRQAGRGRQRGGREALRPLPRPRDVPDPLGAGRGDRLRRARHRPGRAQVPQLARDAGIQQGARALRPLRRPQRDPPARLRAGGRGLHGRGRSRAERLRQRRGDAGHGLHRRTRAEAVPLHRLGGVQLRRRRRRAPRRRARAGGQPAACGRHAHGALPVPAARARPRLRSGCRAVAGSRSSWGPRPAPCWWPTTTGCARC